MTRRAVWACPPLPSSRYITSSRHGSEVARRAVCAAMTFRSLRAVARVAMDGAFFGQLGGVDAAVAAVRARAGVIVDPAVAATFIAHAGEIVEEGQRGDPRLRLLEVEPPPAVGREGSDLVAVATAFGDLADVKVPFMHGHAQEVTRLAVGAARRLRLADQDVAHRRGEARRHRELVTNRPAASCTWGGRPDRSTVILVDVASTDWKGPRPRRENDIP